MKESQLGQQFPPKLREAWVQERCPPASGGISNVTRPARNAPALLAGHCSLAVGHSRYPPEAVGHP
jgi:hypothetical protein